MKQSIDENEFVFSLLVVYTLMNEDSRLGLQTPIGFWDVTVCAGVVGELDLYVYVNLNKSEANESCQPQF